MPAYWKHLTDFRIKAFDWFQYVIATMVNNGFHRKYGRLYCVKSIRIRSFSDPYFPAFRLNTEQKNSEYGHLHAVLVYCNWNFDFDNWKYKYSKYFAYDSTFFDLKTLTNIPEKVY